jgi:hypothetical protein
MVTAPVRPISLSMGDAEEAVELGRQVVTRMPGDVSARTTLTSALWQAGSPADLDRALALGLPRSDEDSARAAREEAQRRLDR